MPAPPRSFNPRLKGSVQRTVMLSAEVLEFLEGILPEGVSRSAYIDESVRMRMEKPRSLQALLLQIAALAREAAESGQHGTKQS